MVPPATILREQAALLREKTNQLVEGDVRSYSVDDSPKLPFRHDFNVVVPSLGNWRYRLFTVVHGVELYPLRVQASFDTFECQTEEQFTEVLRQVLADPTTLKVVSSLVALSANPGALPVPV